MAKIYDLERESLSAALVQALDWSMYPVMEGCEIAWTDEDPEKVNQIFYGQ
jgi:hypothetical protein